MRRVVVFYSQVTEPYYALRYMVLLCHVVKWSPDIRILWPNHPLHNMQVEGWRGVQSPRCFRYVSAYTAGEKDNNQRQEIFIHDYAYSIVWASGSRSAPNISSTEQEEVLFITNTRKYAYYNISIPVSPHYCGKTSAIRLGTTQVLGI